MSGVVRFDTECFINYWLIRFFGAVEESYFAYGEGSALSFEARQRIAEIFEHYETRSFNGIAYDIPMISYAIHGATCAQLKYVNDLMIPGGGQKGVPYWELDGPNWRPANHVDLFNVAPGVRISLKKYGTMMGAPLIQDLPYAHDTRLTLEQTFVVYHYCGNDNQLLEMLEAECAPQMQLRERLSAKYGIDLRSKSDAQMAEAVLKLKCEQANGRKIAKPIVDYNQTFKYTPPGYMAFHTPVLRQLLDMCQSATFQLNGGGGIVEPQEFNKLQIALGTNVYSFGIGGLHSTEERTTVYASDDYILEDIDVESYYPKLMINSGKFPEVLGYQFIIEFSDMMENRLRAKALVAALDDAGASCSVEYIDAQTENDGGKIMINGTFGKTGSAFSVLFAPSMLIHTTLNGQLSILMLIEYFVLSERVRIVSANTDGILVYYHKKDREFVRAAVKAWEQLCALRMESTLYKSIHIHNVNNYFAIKAKDGKAKRKGEFVHAGVRDKKTPDCEISYDAVVEYVRSGTPIETTVNGCDDIRKFIIAVKVPTGGVKLWGKGPVKNPKVSEMVAVLEACGWQKVSRMTYHRNGETLDRADAYAACFEPQTPEFLGGTVRWYYGTNTPGPIVERKSGDRVGRSEGAAPCNRLPLTMPDNVDRQRYIDIARQSLVECGIVTK